MLTRLCMESFSKHIPIMKYLRSIEDSGSFVAEYESCSVANHVIVQDSCSTLTDMFIQRFARLRLQIP